MKSNLTVRTNETIQAPSKVSFSDQISPRMASVGASSNLSSPGRKGKNDLAKLFQNQSKSDTKRLATSHSSYRSSPPIYTQTSTLQLSRKTSSNKVSQMNTFAELLNKIADPGSQNVYEQERDTQIQFGSPRTMSVRESPVSRSNKFTIRQVSNRNTLMDIKSAQTSPKSGGNTIVSNFNQSREENFEKSRVEFLDTVKEDHYKYSKLDSKFEEIQDLKSKNEYLQRENLQLKQDMVDIDEFDEVLKKKTRLENFNEKRCDILKACVRKQKRYIDYMNKTVRMSKTFYKDINHILNFLIELDQKYVKSGLKIDKQTLETLEPPAIQVDMADRGFVEIYKELRNTENVKRFFENFNESYRQLKKMEESNVEIEKLFTLAGRDEKDKAVNPITLHFHPELKKKLKYKYVFKQFVNKYNLIYPIYTVFNEFELRDKNNFSNFVDHLSLMSDRISKVFSRIKNFDMLSHTNFAYNHGISELVVKNKMEFKDYFDRKNPNKRIFLKSEEVFQVERSLSTLLTNLITFHNNLVTKKEDIPIESVLDLQESLRGSIENLLLLGITTTCDFSMGDKILVVTKKNPHGGQSDFLREGYIPEKETLFEVYNQEEDHLHKYQALKNSINNLLKESLKEAEKTHSESMNITIEKLKKQVDSLQTNYEEMGLISRLKDMEMNYMREYSRIAFKDIEKLRIFVEEKLGMVDNTLKGIDGQIKDLERSCGDYLAALKDTKDKIQFQKKFNRVSKEVSEVIQAILSKQRNSFYSDISMLEDTFKTELEKLKKELLRSGDKIKDVTMKIRKG